MNIRLNSNSSDAAVAFRVPVVGRELAVVSVVPPNPVGVKSAARQQDEQEKRHGRLPNELAQSSGVIGPTSQCAFPRDRRALC